ncbi:MAG: TOBE domain-containing protein, partial [Betaproteobacteria bacterium]
RNIVLSANENANALSGMVKKVSYVGSHYEYTIAGEFGEIFAIEDSGFPAKSEGSEVSITFKDGGSCLVPI